MTHDPLPVLQRPAPEQTLFSLRGLAYRYADGTPALAGIDLDVHPGDRIALVGHNGSGKTTLVKQLCGLLTPSTGEVFYRGRPLDGDHLDQARLEIGLLFQDPDDQLFGHTLIADAAFGPRNQGLGRTPAEAAARLALEQVGLAQLAYKAPHNLSFGQKKRAALAGLLAMRPEILILDEPTTNLDPRQEEIFLDLLREFPGTLICISHNLIFLYELCARAVVIERGRIHHDYSLRELVSQRDSLREHGLDFSFRLAAEAPLPSEPGAAEPIRRSPPEPSVNPADPPLVSLGDYRYRYPDGSRALTGVDLDIHRGERLAIVGENGAGKTTLLACLLGLRSGEGSFQFAGEPVTARRRKSLWRRVGMVFQDCADQLFCPSVEEEVAFGLKRLGCSSAETRERTAAALARVHLSGFEPRVPLHLSGGERKRLALACVLAMSPELLILDEPTAGLDPAGEELLLEILADLDATLLLVSHDMFFVGELTRRTVVMHQGRIAWDIPTGQFMRDEALGSLNGLAFIYRRDCGDAIRALQHEHEHNHPHRHRHTHPHRHGETLHTHPHEHFHEHPHRFAHRHPGGDAAHEHPPERNHEHDHPGHAFEPHDHEHE